MAASRSAPRFARCELCPRKPGLILRMKVRRAEGTFARFWDDVLQGSLLTHPPPHGILYPGGERMTILITGFEPFGGDPMNPSWEAVNLLPDHVGDSRIRKLQLPVVFGQCGERLLQAVEKIRPDVVVCCGVAKGRTEVTPELLAVNWRMGAIADNAGVAYAGEKIDPSGPDAIMTELPVGRMVGDVRAAGLPARLSLSAGAYVCNDLYYAVMRGQGRYGYRGLFIHVPAESELPLADIARALLCCLQTLQA